MYLQAEKSQRTCTTVLAHIINSATERLKIVIMINRVIKNINHS